MRNVIERELSSEEREELRDLLQQGIEALGFLVELPEEVDDETVVVKLREAVDAVRNGSYAGDEYADGELLAYSLGTVWGDALRNSLGWEWVYLTSSDFEGAAVVSPDRSRVNHPHHYLFALTTDKGRANNIVLLFNMLHGDNSGLTPGSYTALA